MRHLEQGLQKLGLNEKEALFYTNALELGQFTILEIAHRSGIKRPTCYLIADDLLKRGFISLIPRDKKVFYLAESPNVLIKQAEENIQLAKQLAPELASLYNVSGVQPTVKFYPGRDGVRTAYNDVLKSHIREYRYIGAAPETISVLGKDFLDEWIDRRIKRKIKVHSVRVNEIDISKDYYTELDTTYREIRYAPRYIQLPYTILLYAKKVLVVSTKKDQFAFIVESEDFHLTMRGLFDAAWQISTPIAEMNKPTKKSV